MLRTLTTTRNFDLSRRLLAVAGFAALTAVGAQIEVRIGEFVPFTMQVFAALLAGMVLGGRDGALSQIVYLLLIRLNLPVAAGGTGAAALMGPTAGYIIGFIPAAFVVGWLVEHGAQRAVLRWLAGLAGVAIIYACGLPMLMSAAGLSFAEAWAAGVMPFIGFDLAKAALAVTLSEGGRALLARR
ncbi:MAG TPA: biotin transporter BioY [Spirillospora sp.]|nr:biotin transporter BioY [Spirillospora sp.]